MCNFLKNTNDKNIFNETKCNTFHVNSYFIDVAGMWEQCLLYCLHIYGYVW